VRRGASAKLLAELLGVGVVGRLLDEIGDEHLRDLIMKCQIRAVEIAVDEDSTAALARGADSRLARRE
jgi:hypothetical protein